MTSELNIGLSKVRSGCRPLPSPQAVDFVAIDIETAASNRASICSIGVALVRDGLVVASGSQLINPECSFSKYNIAINGIAESDVGDAPTFPEIWPAVAALLENGKVCAHSATFDMGALRASAARYSMSGPTFDVFCTWRLARMVWPDASAWGLGFIAPWLGIDFDHHEAGSDAEACASVAVAALSATATSNLHGLANVVNYFPPRMTASSYQGVRVIDATVLGSADSDHPLNGKVLAFTGGMFSMSRTEAASLIASLGATFKASVSALVDYLVIGDADFVSFADGQMTRKLARAVELRAEGSPLEILSERDFVALLNS